MLLQGLKPTLALEILHFPTLDDFRSFEHLGDSRNTPLSGRCASARAHIRLPSTTLTVQRTFPRILEAAYRTVGTVCFVPLGREVNVSTNGIEGTANRIMAVNGTATCEIVERQSNLFAIVNLAPSISDRGWPEGVDQIRVVQANNTTALQSFRHTVERLLRFAASDPERASQPITMRSMEDALLASLDEILMSFPTVPPSRQFERHLTTVKRMEDYLHLHATADIYASELASACGVSPRTLQTATLSVRGLSVNRYLRLRRLWSVRRTLALGRPHTKISDVARANGFWHMGEFAAAYRAVFGETPTETSARQA